MTDRQRDNLGYWCARPVAECPEKVALVDLSTRSSAGSADTGRGPSGAARDAGSGAPAATDAREVTYAELDRRLDRVASLLTDRGLRPGDRLAMAVGNRFEFVEIMYGAMRAGAVPVPLNYKLGADVLDYVIRDAGCVAAFVEPGCGAAAVEVIDRIGLGHRFAVDTKPVPGWAPYETALLAASDRFEPPLLPIDHPAFQPYTSGSTGRPKGVILTHAGQLWWIRALSRYWPEKPHSRALAAVPLFHKNAMAGAIKPLLHVGGSVVILPDFEPRRFLTTLAEYRCTQAGAVPAVFALLLQHRDLIAKLDFSALESLSIGSAPVQEELLAEVERVFGVRVRESYGLTEGGPVMIGTPVDGREVPVGSCGVAWPEGEVKLVDAGGRAHPTFGELWVKNPGVTPGYHRLPEVNAQRLKDGWLATGDLFSLDGDGFFYFRGRTDDMFNCGGENIYPKEVENLILSHPAVHDAAVVPVAHPIKGEVPVAMVMLSARATVEAGELERHCLDRGPAYAHPRRVMVVEEMPLNGTGKTDRGRVQSLLRQAFGHELGRVGAR